MSFYWQQGLQDTGQSSQQPQQGQWDFINLGGAPAPQYQWNPAAQQQQQHQNNYYYQQTPQQQPYPAQQPTYNVSNQQQQSAEQNYQQQWTQQPAQHQPDRIQHQPQLPKPKKVQQIEHTPLLQQPTQQNFAPVPPVLTPSYNQAVDQNHYQQQVPQQQTQPAIQNVSTKEPAPVQFAPPPVRQPDLAPVLDNVKTESKPGVPPAQQVVNPSAPVPTPPVIAPLTVPKEVTKKDQYLTIAAPIEPEKPKTKVTPTSSEDDWEKADMEIQQVDDESKRQKTVQTAATTVEKPVESRESSSLGGSWSQQETEPSERSSVEPVEIVEHPVIVEQEEKTPRVSMSENHEPTPNYFNRSVTIEEDRRETPEAGHPNQSTSVILNSSGSPPEAIATSTPKDSKLEKRSSISSQGTIGADKKTDKDKKEHFLKQAEQLAEREEASGNNSDSTLASKPEFVRGEVRASYRECRKAYLAIWDRLNIMRTDSHHSEFRPASKLANPLLAAAGLSRQHPAIRRESTGGRNDGRASVPLHHSQSFNDNMYADQNGGRRSRVSRLDPSARPSSRHGAGYQSVNHSYIDPRQYDQRGYAQNSQYRQGRHSAMALPYDPRRPPSAYGVDPYAANYGQEPQETSSISESEEEEENGESDDEIRGYNMKPEQNHRVHGVPHHQHPGDEALYYCGVVHVNMDTWRRLTEKQGIAPEFYELNPIEKAAFMFNTVVFKMQPSKVDDFRNRFNREFYKCTCAGDSNDDALFKVCRSMQQLYIKRCEQKKLAEQNMKANLFSDDTDGVIMHYSSNPVEPPRSIIVKRQSEINSVYNESVNNYDIYNNGPLKFTCPHTFMNISTGGQVISIQPDQSVSAVVFDDIKSVLKDIDTLQVKDAAMSFKGPLIPHQSASHSVRLYITKQIESISHSAVAENAESDDVVESILVWQLLETMVKQQGNITGPDIAELLAKVASQPVNIEAPAQPTNITPALNKFTEFLLGGHIDEAVEHAMRNGLFADALILTRRLFPNDERKIEQIETRFLQTRSLNNPVTTLVSVAKGEKPPVLTNPPLDDHMSWRTHAAIILANLGQRETALSTIHKLGEALAKRDYNCAADFCFLVCGVLGGKNPFEPIAAPDGEEDYRGHIPLVNSDIPDNEQNPKCHYGFLISDLHATEIFDYAIRLKETNRESLLARSVEYQTTRLKYAKLLSSHGFNSDAYRYCTQIACDIWYHWNMFPVDFLLELCDLAEAINHKADVNPQETQWIYNFREMIQASFLTRPVAEPVVSQGAENRQTGYEHQQQLEPVYNERTEILLPTPVPAAIPELAPTESAFTAPAEHQPLQHEHQENTVPPTPTTDEHVAYDPETPFSQNSSFGNPLPDDGFTTQSDFNDGPLTMASSQPVMSTAPPLEPIPAQHAQNQVAQPQPKLPAEVPMSLPDPSTVWEDSQKKSDVKQDDLPPPMPMPSAPPMGGGIRAARAASRFAKTTNSAAAQPPVMPTFNSNWAPAPVDDDGESANPFSVQNTQPVAQNQPMPSDE
uniref:Protein transport protein sec16 n=1 Tax=Caenorhabditis tropicalis TaxID=1561998 RepID=A0A1I7TNG6_9PELO